MQKQYFLVITKKVKFNLYIPSILKSAQKSLIKSIQMSLKYHNTKLDCHKKLVMSLYRSCLQQNNSIVLDKTSLFTS